MGREIRDLIGCYECFELHLLRLHMLERSEFYCSSDGDARTATKSATPTATGRSGRLQMPLLVRNVGLQKIHAPRTFHLEGLRTIVIGLAFVLSSAQVQSSRFYQNKFPKTVMALPGVKLDSSKVVSLLWERSVGFVR